MKNRKPQFTLYAYNKESQDSTQDQDQPKPKIELGCGIEKPKKILISRRNPKTS